VPFIIASPVSSFSPENMKIKINKSAGITSELKYEISWHPNRVQRLSQLATQLRKMKSAGIPTEFKFKD
jgi:hypothetical protein